MKRWWDWAAEAPKGAVGVVVPPPHAIVKERIANANDRVSTIGVPLAQRLVNTIVPRSATQVW